MFSWNREVDRLAKEEKERVVRMSRRSFFFFGALLVPAVTVVKVTEASEFASVWDYQRFHRVVEKMFHIERFEGVPSLQLAPYARNPITAPEKIAILNKAAKDRFGLDANFESHPIYRLRDDWYDKSVHAVRERQRLGIQDA
jgi:hypothetical protein